MNGYVNAERLKELYELCHITNFNTSEKALVALQNGISKLLNNPEVLEMNIYRLKSGDQFEAVRGGKTYTVVSRFTNFETSVRLEELHRTGKEPHIHVAEPRVIVNWLQIAPQDGSDVQFVDMETGFLYNTVAGLPTQDAFIGPSVFLISKP